MYKKFVHYGCSFTYGQDSGGDDIDDYNKSYPAYLSRLVNNDFVNRANAGASLEQISLNILQDLSNPESDINKKNVLVIVNLTSAFRIMSSLKNWWSIDINNKSLSLCNINPVTPDSISKEINDIQKKLIYEQDWIMYFNAYTILNSIFNHLTLYKKDFIFVDVLLNLNTVTEYFPLHDAIRKKCINFGSNRSGIVKHIADQGKKYHHFYSKSQHYNSNGYKHMAELVFEKLKENMLA